MGNNWIKANAIYSDSQGVYIQSDSILGFWECWGCGALNLPWHTTCHVCGRPG